MRKQKGVSLLELLLVLAIIAALLAIIGMQYNWMKYRSNLESFQEGLNLSKQALFLYYEKEKCFKDFYAKPNPSFADVTALLHHRNLRIRNPWAANQAEPFSFNVILNMGILNSGDSTTNPVLKVSTTLRVAATKVEGIAQFSGGQWNGGKKITWTFAPGTVVNKMTSSMWLTNSMVGNFKRTINKVYSINECYKPTT